jgi:hypothetical protein
MKDMARAARHSLHHWFAPHPGNNFRARLLHNSGILFVIGIVLGVQLFVRTLDSTPLHILGFTSSVTIDEVVRLTNERRVSSGLPPLTYSEKLADAARRKAANMFAENYWAHNSPSGKSPWVWFQAAGYAYTFAGENLAKDFGDSSRLIEAWMASPTHRANIMNDKYKEIGVAVVPGNLEGSDTVLVVQLFGAPSAGSTGSVTTNDAPKTAVVPARPQVAVVQGEVAAAPTPAQPTVEEVKEVGPTVTPAPTALPAASPLGAYFPRFSEFSLTKTVNLATTALFILALVIDLVLAESAKLSRRVGKNWAHIVFVNVILLAVTIVNAGKIM